MIKDRMLKLKLLRYFILNFWYPEMEVNVMSKERLSNVRKIITDVDVVGLYLDPIGDLKKYLGDCKTLKNQSPIARGFWMKGLIDYLGATKGLILLSKEVEKEHQLSAHELNVQIFSDKDFDEYSKRTADYLSGISSALSLEENWTTFLSIPSKHPRLTPMHDYCRTVFWNEASSKLQLRSGIYYLKTNKGELNPANKLHLAVVLNHISLVAISMNNLIITVFNKYLIPSTKDELDHDLKVLIYGGIENYEFLNDLRKKFAAASTELALPEWPMFLELVRTFLERPLAFGLVPLMLKEISFELVSEELMEYNYAKIILKKDAYICTFSQRFIEYMCKACNLPPEFRDIFVEEITMRS